jgi:hypothetical protein
MASDLETSLINGGITPAAAKVISNAIDNVATGRTNIGRQLADATPTKAMRLIDSDTRRYVLTNLDYPTKPAGAGGPTLPNSDRHPYEGSQPASANPTLATPGVKPGSFVSVASGSENEVAQAEVSLNVTDMGGQHARLNQSTGAVEAVPISVEFEPKGLLEADVFEEAGRTVIKIRIVSTAIRQLLGKRFAGNVRTFDSVNGECAGYVEGSLLAPGRAFLLITE